MRGLEEKRKAAQQCGLVDDIGLEPMTFRTSKETPAGNHIPAGENTAFFGGKSINRVDPIDTNLSYRGRKNEGYLYRDGER